MTPSSTLGRTAPSRTSLHGQSTGVSVSCPARSPLELGRFPRFLSRHRFGSCLRDGRTSLLWRLGSSVGDRSVGPPVVFEVLGCRGWHQLFGIRGITQITHGSFQGSCGHAIYFHDGWSVHNMFTWSPFSVLKIKRAANWTFCNCSTYPCFFLGSILLKAMSST